MPGRRKKATNPFRGVVDAINEMNRIAERMTGADGITATQHLRGHADAWSPITDILAKDDDLVIRCELPGVAPEEVEVSYSRGTLNIAGERQAGDALDQDYLVQERSYGQFRRDITLPEGVEQDDIEADFSDGVLEVTVRRAAGAAGPSQIAVRTPKER